MRDSIHSSAEHSCIFFFFVHVAKTWSNLLRLVLDSLLMAGMPALMPPYPSVVPTATAQIPLLPLSLILSVTRLTSPATPVLQSCSMPVLSQCSAHIQKALTWSTLALTLNIPTQQGLMSSTPKESRQSILCIQYWKTLPHIPTRCPGYFLLLPSLQPCHASLGVMGSLS